MFNFNFVPCPTCGSVCAFVKDPKSGLCGLCRPVELTFHWERRNPFFFEKGEKMVVSLTINGEEVKIAVVNNIGYNRYGQLYRLFCGNFKEAEDLFKKFAIVEHFLKCSTSTTISKYGVKRLEQYELTHVNENWWILQPTID